MLEVDIEKTTGTFKLQVSFSAGKGALGILGSSGSGKSLTLKCIAGLFSPDKGTIKLNGTVLFSSNDNIKIPPQKRNIGYVFQNYALFPHLTVRKNIAYGIAHLDAKTQKEKVSEMIARMQLAGIEDYYPNQLSGGQQQRTALARTLITEPALLLLDEPFAALDNHIKYLLEKELLTIIKKNFNGIVLLVTHNIEEAYRIADNIMIIDNGKNIQTGGREEIIHAPVNLAAARITGCKNFLNVHVLQEKDTFLILQSGNLVFNAAKPAVPSSHTMIAGIRAHYLSLTSGESDKGNSFDCEIIEQIEGVFSSTMIVNCSGLMFRVEVAKASNPHSTTSSGKKLKLHIPADKIFLIQT